MPRNKKSEMYLDDIIRFLQEADEDQQQMPPAPEGEAGPAPEEEVPQDDQQLNDIKLDVPEDANADDSSDGDKDASDAENENPDDAMGNDAAVSDDKAIESTKDDVMDIINKSLKEGKKVNISIMNASEDIVTTEEYNALVKKRKTKGITEAEALKIKKYEKSILEMSKNRKLTSNEKNLVEVASVLSDRINEMEEELNGKSILDSFSNMSNKSKINKFDEAVEDFDKSIKEYEELMESYAGKEEYNILKEAYSEIASDVAKYRDLISESAANAKLSVKYFNILRQNNIIDESAVVAANISSKIKNTQEAMLESENVMEAVKNKMNNVTKAMLESENAMMNLKSKLNFLREDSAISMDAVGFDKSMKATYYEAPEYITKTYGKAGDTYPKSDLSEVVDSKGYIDKRYSSFFKLPLAKNAETGKLSTNSAMSAIAEAFTDENGTLNCKAVAPAFLYQKTRNPKTISDFSFPIGAMEEGALVVVPKFVEDTVKLLENDVALSKIYKIPESEIDTIRGKLVPYMEDLKIEIPWD